MKYKKIYNEIFSNNIEYNNHIIDRDRYNFAINEVINKNYKKIIDISSGRGYYIKYLMEHDKTIDITSTDISKFNDIDIRFIELDLVNKEDYLKLNPQYDFLTCLDVLEHIEEEYIDQVLEFLSNIATNFCFSIANHSDIQKGVELHLIQKNKEWWDNKLNNYFTIYNSYSIYNNRLYCYILKSKV